MTSQIQAEQNPRAPRQSGDCKPPANAPKNYCKKLKSGIARLEASLQTQYEQAFPIDRNSIAQAIREAKDAAWSTAFPSLFFPVLAHLRINEMRPSA